VGVVKITLLGPGGWIVRVAGRIDPCQQPTFCDHDLTRLSRAARQRPMIVSEQLCATKTEFECRRRFTLYGTEDGCDG
jgi:hypothetical protein